MQIKDLSLLIFVLPQDCKQLYTFSNGSPYCLIHKTRFCFTKKQIITPYIFLIKFLYGDIRIFSRYVLIF